MELTKQRKMLIGVLCLGLGGLILDRVLLGPPDSASASVGVSPVPSPPASEPAGTPQAQSDEAGNDTASLPSYASLTKRLVEAQSRQPVESGPADRDDPFRLPDQWQADRSKPAEQNQREASDSVLRLRGLFKLNATVRSLIDGEEEMLAVISGGGQEGRAVRVGQKIRVPLNNGGHEEYELVEVGSRYVVWFSQKTKKRVLMRVEEVL